ncbi:MAG: Tat pathway signal sequence [Coriobacteriales bacterium]|jgi:hypothetical protein
MRQSNPWSSSGKSGKSESPFGKGFPFNFDLGREEGEADDYEVPGSKGSGGGAGFKVPGKWRKLGKKLLVIAIIVAIVVLLLLYWWFHPPINIHSSDLWVFCTIFILLPLFLVFRGYRKAYETGTDKREKDDKKAHRFKLLSRVPVIILIIGILGGVASATFFPFNAGKYAHVLETQELDFAADIKEVDYNSIPVIDYNSAALLGNRAMGTMADYVSQFEISGIYSQINYKNRPVRVSPLNYAGIIKWITNMRTGIPAYVIVDMASQDTKIVRLEQPIKYSESDPLFRNIDRYVQLKFPFYMFDQKSFEIDEEGIPYWVCPVQKRTIGLFGGTTISRVVLCNASTGECQDLAVEDVPSWVDRAYPTDLLIQQYNWSGLYINGWWNSWLGQEGVKQTTPGTDGMLGYNYIAKDDDVWVYTGVTSATADDSIIGFVLINQRTAESHFYPVSGATENSAMYSAEGQVQNLRYNATFPLLLNINGQPTYFMALKDAAGLVKKYAMVDIQRYQNVAIGDTVSDCQKSYKALLATNGFVASGDDASGLQEAKGTIRTMVQAVVDGNSHFYVTLEDDDHIYDCPVSVIEIVSYREGDSITFQYYEGSPTCTVMGIGKMSEEDIAARQQELEAQQQAASQDAQVVDQAAA